VSRSSTTEDDAARLRELGYEPELARTLSVRDLVIHGLIYMVPLAPIGVFGILYNMSAGAVAAVYVIAAVAMLFSAISYKEMAQVFPVSGSTYSYVSLGTNRFLHPHRVVGLDRLRQPDGTFRLEEFSVHIDADIDIGANCLAYRTYVRRSLARGAVVRHVAGRLDAHLQSRVSVLFDHLLGVLAGLFRRLSTRALVDADLVPHPSAEQGPDRNTRGFSRDIPQRMLDPTHG